MDTTVMLHFDRFCKNQLAELDSVNSNGSFTLAEARVIYELAEREGPTAASIAKILHMDRGYLSRMLASFSRRKLIRKTPSREDKRRSHLELTDKGRQQFAALDAAARKKTADLLEQFSPYIRQQLLRYLQQAGSILQHKGNRAAVIFRPPRNGDLGWIVYRHGAAIAEEFGFDQRFEALCGRIIGDFAANYDAARDYCWVAEYGGEVVGSLFLVKENERTGRIRLLYVESHMRGQKIGQRLIDKAIRHARKVGYHKVVLFTNGGLDAAHHLYEKAGFRLISEAPHNLFGQNQSGQEWELIL